MSKSEPPLNLLNPAVIVAKISWDTLDKRALAAAYFGATFDGEGRISPLPTHNIAFDPARDFGLIDEKGLMREEVFQALLLSLEG